MVRARSIVWLIVIPLLSGCAHAYRPVVQALDGGDPVEIIVPTGIIEEVGGDDQASDLTLPESYRVLAEDVAEAIREAWPEAQVVVADEPGAEGGGVSMMLMIGGAFYPENGELAPQVSIVPVQGSASRRLGKNPRNLGQVRLIATDTQEGLGRALESLRQIIQRAMPAWVSELQEAR